MPFARTFQALAGVLLLTTAYAQAPLEHRIPPGYEPGERGDEASIWLEVDAIEKALRESALLVTEPSLNNYVGGLACRVAGDYCDDIRVYLVRNPGFNASMMPNGAMQIWTGLLTRTRSRDELAAVIGHEIGHFTRLHTLERHRSLRKGLSAGSFLDLGIGVATGVNLPVASMTAMLSTLAFSREQESEADLIGAGMLADASLDPHAAYAVWLGLLEEESAAETKRREPGVFARTHPDAGARAAELRAWVSERYGPRDREMFPDDEHVQMLNRHYLFLMEDQVDTNRFGRTGEMLKRHRELGVEPSLVRYFYGEMYRQRGKDGDAVRAIDAYRHAIELGNEPAEAHRNLAYLLLKQDDADRARRHFREYLAMSPDATDREMIEFYLEDDIQ